MSTKPPLIAIYSPAMGSGKSVVAQHLATWHGYELMRFAGPLKAMIRSMLREAGIGPYLVDRMIDADLKEAQIPGFAEGVTPRKLMQTLGTEWGRNLIQSDLWTSITMKRAQLIVEKGGRVVIDDLRFGNEYGAVFNCPGAKLLKLVRPGKEITRGHVSEGALEHCGFDWTIVNDGTLDDLRAKIDEVVR
jgi:hypothetical protein